MPSDNPSSQTSASFLKSYDWWAVWLGLFVFALALGPIFEKDLLGWVVQHHVWTEIGQSVRPISNEYASLSGGMSAFLTYLFMLGLTSVAVIAMGRSLWKYIIGFTIVFWVVFGCMVTSNYAIIAATPEMREAFEIPWSLGLGDKGYVMAIILGLLVGNFLPSFAQFLRDAVKPEWFISTGIVILGAIMGLKALQAFDLAGAVIFRGLYVAMASQLIFWPLVYFISRKLFGFTPEWALPLAFGCSTSGASAVIATGGAIKAAPQIITLLSSVIVLFTVIELRLLPWFAEVFLYKQPLVAGAWIGLAIKTDGGVIGAAALTDSLIRAKALAMLGHQWADGWILMTATTTRVFIDSFVGVWTFVVAAIWSIYHLDGKSTAGRAKVSFTEIWQRFPKFILGFLVTFLVILIIGLINPQSVKAAQTGAGHANALRTLFFSLCFFSVGLGADVRKVWVKGMGRVMAAYLFCVVGFMIWIGLLICWVLYSGLTPPLVPQ